jgi:DNA polymerase-3 subunit epsilon
LRYSVVDIETTGGNPQTEKITEIAIFIFDGEKIIDEYTTLINPERPIPPHITNLTGITNAMVADAPRFYEVARDIVLKTDNSVFVAHNAAFDYGFIKNEFKSLGFEFERQTLDTVRLSRKLIPGHASYSLGNICRDLGIIIEGRHRAAGDALATVKLFELLINIAGNGAIEKKEFAFAAMGGQNPLISKLPAETGVYYFNDSTGNLIYIGKSINIKQRAIQHFNNAGGRRAIEMRQKITDISFELTGSELIAMLLESEEIKKHKPLFNRAQRRSIFNYGIYTSYNHMGYITLKLERNNQKLGVPLTTYATLEEGRSHLFRLIDEYQLCMKLCGQYNTDGACFHHGISKCKGACIEAEPASDYNTRALSMIGRFNFQSSNFMIVDKGRDDSEKSLVWICNGKYMGFGFLSNEWVGNTEQMTDCIKHFTDNRDVRQIIQQYIRQKKYLKIIDLSSSNP